MIQLGYKSIGQGDKKIIFLHELMGDHTNYNAILPFLDTQKYSFIFVDLRGYGLSKHIKGEYNLKEAIDDIKNLIDKLGIDNYFLVAHSMSTMIAQNLALEDKRIKKLILITPISISGIKTGINSKKNLLEQMAKEGKIEEIVEDSSKRYNQTWKEYRINLAYNCSTLEARLGYMNMYLNSNFKTNEEKIEIPIKIIVGKYDFSVFALKQINKIFSKYKNVEIIECQEAGHYPMIECPVFFASQLELWCS